MTAVLTARTRSAAYYNEIDPYAAEWLRRLIAAGHIAPGDVDERDIRDVRPDDLRGYRQCHFFAGIGGWSLALRLAGWPDDRPVWTGSCPCQPFSAAGRGDGFADERHLWPDWHWLIAQCRPAVVFGEQVASKAADAWLELVSADMEGLGYGVGAVPIPAAGIGAPHIRDRLWWVADASRDGRGEGGTHAGRQPAGDRAQGRAARLVSGGADGRLADADGGHAGAERQQRSGQHGQQPRDRGVGFGLADAGGAGLEGRDAREVGRQRPAAERGGRAGGVGHAQCVGAGRDAGASPGAQGGAAVRAVGNDAGPSGAARGVADAVRDGAGARGPAPTVSPDAGGARRGIGAEPGDGIGDSRTGPLHGFWRDADWLLCRDGKWRPIEPGTFPLAHGVSNRVGRLRAYGNAIVPEAAAEFIRAWLGGELAVTAEALL